MSKLEKKNITSIGDAIRQMLHQTRLSQGLNTQCIFEAWDEASGAGRYTQKRFYRDGILYITTSSSVICSQLEFQKKALVEKINHILEQDELFISDDPAVGPVRELRLK